MSRTGRSASRRTTGLVGLIAALALIAAPSAFADSFNTAANVNFNGVVDSAPTCTDASAITIHWGDGSASTGTYRSNLQIQGNHTYRSATTFNGTITFTGGTNCGTGDSLTANVAPTPQFPQCPQVGADIGCQFLIDVTAGGTTVLGDSTQGPYENSDDALIGLKNDSSSPLSSIPISTPGSPVFGFEQDGLCDNAAGPVPTACQQLTLNSGDLAAPGLPCDPSAGTCATPQPPGQPGPDAAPYLNTTRNGYEGPGTFYTNISVDQSSGRVNFSPAVPPGATTYFSLEEPPSANALNVGATPIPGGLSSAPTVTPTTASFVAVVNPNGAATTAQFQFNLDRRYGKVAAVTQSTPLQSVGGDFADHVVQASVAGLAPNALYHVHLVAKNKNGQTAGPDVTFKTSAAPAPGSPTVGRTFNLQPVRGVVLIKVHGLFQPLTQLRQFPQNSLIDALGGSLRVITALPGSGHARDAAAKGKKHKVRIKTQSGTFGGAIFKLTQARSGLAALSLVENAFTGAPSYGKCKARKAADATAAALSSRTLQLLRASAKGRFSTKGRYSSATVRGTKWTIADRCDGTLVHDITDSVSVSDFVHHTTVILHAGQSYLATKP